MNKILKSSDSDFLKKFHEVVNYDRSEILDVSSVVSDIIKNVRERGDAAVIEYTSKLDRNNEIQLEVSNDSIEEYIKDVPEDIKDALDLAAERIKNYHQKQLPADQSYQDENETTLGYFWRAVESVGIYVPGGTASYPSTVLMNCIPAIVAGVKNIYLTTPALGVPVNPAIIYAAKKCGVKEIYKTGGAHSIAALTYGTKIFKKVDKIVGPGNAFVAAAKKEVFGEVGIDMVAGPSEVSIVADKDSNPEWIASDLIAQAEHDSFSQSILITNSKDLINTVYSSLKSQLRNLPKKNIASKSLKNYGLAVYCSSKKRISEVVNLIAPEHLEICFNAACLRRLPSASASSSNSVMLMAYG